VSPILQDGFPTLEPPEDAMVEDAEELVDLLNGKIENLAYTGPVRPEIIDQPGRGAVAKRESKRRQN